jgi:hypothetical protein
MHIRVSTDKYRDKETAIGYIIRQLESVYNCCHQMRRYLVYFSYLSTSISRP